MPVAPPNNADQMRSQVINAAAQVHPFLGSVLDAVIPKSTDPGALTALAMPLDFTAINGSGESSASMEALNRQTSEKANSIKYSKVNTNYTKYEPVPMSSIDAADYVPKPGEVILRQTPQGTTVHSQGRGAMFNQNRMPK